MGGALTDLIGTYEIEWSVEDSGGFVQTVATPTRIRVKGDF